MQPQWKAICQYHWKLSLCLRNDPATPLQADAPQKRTQLHQKDTDKLSLFITAQNYILPKCSSTVKWSNKLLYSGKLYSKIIKWTATCNSMGESHKWCWVKEVRQKQCLLYDCIYIKVNNSETDLCWTSEQQFPLGGEQWLEGQDDPGSSCWSHGCVPAMKIHQLYDFYTSLIYFILLKNVH